MKKIIKNGVISIQKISAREVLTRIGIISALIFIVVGSIGLVLLQSSLKESRDDRQQASVDTGSVLVTTTPATGTTLPLNQPQTVTLNVNTQGTQVSGVQLVFHVITTGVNTINISPVAGSPLTIEYSEVDTSGSDFVVAIMALPSQLGTTFGSTTDTPFATISFTPTTTGTMRLVFDAEASLALNMANNQDELRTISDITYQLGTDPIVIAPTVLTCQANGFVDNFTQTTLDSRFNQVGAGNLTFDGTHANLVVPVSTATTADPRIVFETNGVYQGNFTTEMNVSDYISSGNYQGSIRLNVEAAGKTSRHFVVYLSQISPTQSTISTSGLDQTRQPLPAIQKSVTISNTLPIVLGLERVGSTIQAYYRVGTGAPVVVAEYINFSENVFVRPALRSDGSNLTLGQVSASLDSLSVSCPDTAGMGGTSYRQCNEYCSSSSECAPNSFCYNDGTASRCRLANNATSTTCQLGSTSDNGSACNSYCVTSRDCQTGLMCANDRCRRPDNSDSTTCQAPSSQTNQIIANSCQEECSSNRDCATNLRCYSGECRLASNPGSMSCSAGTSSTVTETFYGVSTKNSSNKGTDLMTDDDYDFVSASARPSSTASARPSSTVKPTSQPTSPADNSSMTLGQRLLAWFPKTISTPIKLLGAGFGILLIVILLAFLNRDRDQNPPQPTTRPKDPSVLKYESEIQSKINALKADTSRAPVSTMNSVPNRLPGQPVASQPMAPSISTAARPASAPVQSVRPNTAPSAPSGTVTVQRPTTSAPQVSTQSMMDRLKAKGIKPPQS